MYLPSQYLLFLPLRDESHPFIMWEGANGALVANEGHKFHIKANSLAVVFGEIVAHLSDNVQLTDAEQIVWYMTHNSISR